MSSASFPKYQGAGGAGENLPTVHNIHGMITLATPPMTTWGKGFVPTRTSQGLYRITFNQQVGRILDAKGMLVLPATTTEARFLRGVILPVDSNNYVEFVITDAAGAVQDPVGADQLSFTISVMLTRQPA